VNSNIDFEGRIRSIFIGETRAQMGLKAARDIATDLRRILAIQPRARVIFAAAPSQSEMLGALVQEPDIDWARVTAFHMDEYIGLDPAAPQRFSLWLRRALFDLVPFGEVHIIDPDENASRVIPSYEKLLAEGPIDIVCLGIGTNGHLAFNDPPCDFEDGEAVKVVTLDVACRQQQVDDGCFADIRDVPVHAITLTIPRLLAADKLFCCAPGRQKREAVRRTIQDRISPDCPATALRLHSNCYLYLDVESAQGLAEFQMCRTSP
jgi:glucosamine-6-phosphate deaminase